MPEGCPLADTRRFPAADRGLRDHRLDRHLQPARAAAGAARHRARDARRAACGAAAHQPVDPLDRARQPHGRAALGPLRPPAHRARCRSRCSCSAAPRASSPKSLGMLVAARVVQAFGGGAAMSVMRATILDHFGPAKAASALAATATAILVAPMLAPTLGGFVLEWLDWRAVFALSGILGFGGVHLRLAEPARCAARRPVGRAVAALLVELPAAARLARVPRLPGVRLLHGEHDLHVRDAARPTSRSTCSASRPRASGCCCSSRRSPRSPASWSRRA